MGCLKLSRAAAVVPVLARADHRAADFGTARARFRRPCAGWHFALTPRRMRDATPGRTSHAGRVQSH